MEKPKTVKSFLKMLLAIAHTNRDDLKGKMTEEEYTALGDIRAGIQNDLGENSVLLSKHNLKYKSSNEE